MGVKELRQTERGFFFHTDLLLDNQSANMKKTNNWEMYTAQISLKPGVISDTPYI